MLRITKQTDYGIMLLAKLAELGPESMLSARDAARWCGLSLPMASKILKALARGGILHSHRGVSGGYSLARPPEETSLASVIRALEGPISMVDCTVGPGHCDQESVCPVRVNWSRINRVIENALELMPISAMIADQPRELLTLAGSPSEPADPPHPLRSERR